MSRNIDLITVEDFGKEWSRFDQSAVGDAELQAEFGRYFEVFPWSALPANAVGFDMGCGSGRWARIAAERVGLLHCIDASGAALDVARKNLQNVHNVEFHRASVDAIPLADNSMDFGYSLGVLHHIPDTGGALSSCVSKLKPGAPLLVYLYYSFDNRPFWFRATWKVSDAFRNIISRLPFSVKRVVTDIIAAIVYFPFAKFSLLAEKLDMDVDGIPLSTYRRHSFYTMRTDALDRFGTTLEQRFSKQQITELMENNELENIRFSEKEPYWCAVGFKAKS